MKFNCGPTPEERREARAARCKEKYLRLTNWHRYFAWHPVRIGSGDCRWLEWVERRCHYILSSAVVERTNGYGKVIFNSSIFWTDEYRPLGDTKNA